MRVLILYHEHSEHGGIVTDFVTEFERYKGRKIELVSLETTEGAQLAELYGVDQYPAILTMVDNGSLLRMWQGLPLPLMDELSYYTQDAEAPASHSRRTIMPLSAVSA